MACLLWLIFPYTLFPILASSKPSIFLSQEHIDKLIHHGVFHLDQMSAQDIDNIYTTEAMKCLTSYTLHPSFIDPSHDVALSLAKD